MEEKVTITMTEYNRLHESAIMLGIVERYLRNAMSKSSRFLDADALAFMLAMKEGADDDAV